MRALRRATLDYWYATIEDLEAASLEAFAAAMTVNILDEAVFEDAHGATYRGLRAGDRLGLVVMGLELVRNCEVHAPVVFQGLLVPRAAFGVPSAGGSPAQRSRQILAWAAYDDLPTGYRDLPAGASGDQMRARKEAQHGYRQAVQDRSVIETIFDATAFFQTLDSRLAADQPPPTRWGFAVVMPDTDPAVTAPTRYFLARPLELDRWEVALPDVACRWWERRSAAWPAMDRGIEELVRRAKVEPPPAARKVQYRVLDNSAQLVGYSGTQPDGGSLPSWTERHQQVWRDVRSGCRYFIVDNDQNVELQDVGHNQLAAPDTSGVDRLAALPVASSMPFNFDRMKTVEAYPDLYLNMRHGYSS